MGFVCCVPGCYTKNAAYRFPQDSELRQRWLVNINRLAPGSTYKLFTPTSNHRVCRNHFEGGSKTPVNNIPTIFADRVLKSNRRLTRTSRHTTHKNVNPTGRVATSASTQPENITESGDVTDSLVVATNETGSQAHHQTPTPSPSIQSQDFANSEVSIPHSSQIGSNNHPVLTEQEAYNKGILVPPVSLDIELPLHGAPSKRKSCSGKYYAQPKTWVITDDHTYHATSEPQSTPRKTKLKEGLKTSSSSIFRLSQSLSKAKAETKLLKSRILDSQVIENDTATLNLYTGFKDKQDFHALLGFLEPDATQLLYPNPSSDQTFRNPLSFANSLLLTLTKYKLDTPQEDLAFR